LSHLATGTEPSSRGESRGRCTAEAGQRLQLSAIQSAEPPLHHTAYRMYWHSLVDTRQAEWGQVKGIMSPASLLPLAEHLSSPSHHGTTGSLLRPQWREYRNREQNVVGRNRGNTRVSPATVASSSLSTAMRHTVNKALQR